MSTNLYWADGPWSGKLALAARPRGGDWLGDEISAWRKAGVDTILYNHLNFPWFVTATSTASAAHSRLA